MTKQRLFVGLGGAIMTSEGEGVSSMEQGSGFRLYLLFIRGKR